MRPEDVIALLGVMSIVSFTVLRIVTTVVSRNRQQKALPDDSAERLARIEQAVDAIAVEVERISEAQRFTTKQLTEKSREPA